MTPKQLGERLRPFFLEQFSLEPSRPCRIFLSASDMNSRAIVRHASALDPSQAWDDALAELELALGSIEPKILRADWIANVESMTWSSFNEFIEQTRRGYFRSGLALPDFSIAFTESELNSNLIINGGKEHFGGFQAEHGETYCRARFGKSFPSLQPSSSIVVFDTLGAFVSTDLEQPLSIDRNGHRLVSPLDSELIAELDRSGNNWIARQIRPNGQFINGYFPADARQIISYYALRHFTSLNALLDHLEREQSDELRQAIGRALDYGINSFIRWRPLEDGSQAAYVEEKRKSNVKLESNGIALAALSKFTELTKSNKYMPIMSALAREIMSRRDVGGESLFGLLKFYSIGRDEKLLASAESAVENMIAAKRWKALDHWLSMALNELTKHRPLEKYFELGIDIFADQLSFIRDHETQMPPLLTLISAADEMLERLKQIPELSRLLERIDFNRFYAAMEARAKNMLNGYFYPEQAMYFARPNSIVGSFYMRRTEFRVRIDDIARYVMGFEAYRKYLGHRTEASKLVEENLSSRKNLKPVEPKKTSGEAEIFYAGDVVIARRLHWRVREVKQIRNVPAMRRADLRIVNLECAVATAGEQGVEKGEGGPYYYHARPEMLNVVTDANVDVVLTANNHCGDYGPEAVLEQKKYLDEAGLIHVGSGANFEEASAPIFVKVNGLIIAIFSVDAVTKYFAATEDRAGTFFLPLNKPELWRSTFEEKIADARRFADVVLVAPHWGLPGIKAPLNGMKTIGRILIDCGADAVLGCHSHNIHGVETYNGRPIVYDAGDFLFESEGREKDTGCFSLTIDRSGVKRIEFTPLKNGYGYVVMATRSRDRINEWFAGMCRELGTEASIKDGTVEIKFAPAPRGEVERDPSGEAPKIFEPPLEHTRIEPLAEPRPEWIVDEVPKEAEIEPFDFGSIKLLGYRIAPELRTMSKRRLLYVETYWTIDRPIDQDCRLSITAKPVRECQAPTWGSAMEHDFCDWMWPIDRWKPGVIYRERFGLRPPEMRRILNVDLRVEIRVRVDGKLSRPFIDPQLILMKFPHTPLYRTEFPDIIYESKPGQCWNAKQLEAVTGGKWLVEPPEGWYTQSFFRNSDKLSLVEHPTMLIATSFDKHVFHQFGTVLTSNSDTHTLIPKLHDKLAGAIVSHPVKGAPPDFPLLMVDDPVRASMEIGFAARKRFRGKMIGVTGSSGKTTTCNMLSHVLGQEHVINSTYSTSNMYVIVPTIFANTKQEAAYSIIEISINAINKPRGSITYEVPPNIAVVTSLIEVHLESHKSVEEIAHFKSQICNGMSPGDYAVFNRDMILYEIFEKKAKSQRLNIITFGRHPDSTIRMETIKNGGTFTLNGKTYTLECPVPDEQIYDALAVVGVSLASGCSIEKTLEYLKTFKPVEGRGNLVDAVFNGKKIRVIDSTYNANPISMKGAIDYLKTVEPQAEKRVAIIGDMLELGNDTIRLHRSLADSLLDAAPDRAMLVGELMRNLYEDVKNKCICTWLPTYKEAIDALDGLIKDGDTVLLKSSHGTHLDKVVSALTRKP